MIPKIIHLCWLSGENFPDDISKCLKSWNTYLPDYEIMLWDTKRFDINSTIWTKQAFEAKKYAFAADYIRLYALYKYGGIYLDADIMVYKSFNDLLELPYFLGEDYVHCFEPAVVGCEPHMPWIKDVLDRYNGLEFINKDGSYNMRGLPLVYHDMLTPKYKFERITKVGKYNYNSRTIKIFSKEYFNSRDFVGIIKTKYSYCSHNYLGSWLKKRKKSQLKRIIPRAIANLMYFCFQVFFLNKKIKGIQIPYSNT